MRFAYADPPYPGHTRRGLYKADPKCAEVDHAELVARLVREFPDGWALSTGSNNLREVLPLCPPDVRVGSWVKPFAIFKPNVNPAYAWEPVIFRGGRKLGREVATVRDWVSANVTIKRGVAGAKPRAFCRWLFDLWGVVPGDELVDLYPGTGAVSRAWAELVVGLPVANEGQASLFGSLGWRVVNKGDPSACALADRHYSRRKPGAPQFMPPGQTLCLLAPGAVWGWWRPDPKSGIKAMNGLDGWTCTIFRNESSRRSSDLVLEAETMLRNEVGACGPDGMLTYVWDKKLRSTNPGYCFKRAGWVTRGRSADGRKTLLGKPFELAGVAPAAKESAA